MPGERTRKFKEHDPADRWGGSAGGEGEYSLKGGKEVHETKPKFVRPMKEENPAQTEERSLYQRDRFEGKTQPQRSPEEEEKPKKVNRKSKRKRAA